jgi:hypothetical protein
MAWHEDSGSQYSFTTAKINYNSITIFIIIIVRPSAKPSYQLPPRGRSMRWIMSSGEDAILMRRRRRRRRRRRKRRGYSIY